MRLLLAGGTGLIGGKVLRLGLNDGHEITTVGRRPTGMASSEIVSGFDDLPRLPPADIAICALGTTIRQAGSQAAFRAIDEEAVVSFAAAAKTANVDHFLVVTAVGANPDASVFYSRVKGAAEQRLVEMGFKRLDIIRPGLLLLCKRRRAHLAGWRSPGLRNRRHQRGHHFDGGGAVRRRQGIGYRSRRLKPWHG